MITLQVVRLILVLAVFALVVLPPTIEACEVNGSKDLNSTNAKKIELEWIKHCDRKVLDSCIFDLYSDADGHLWIVIHFRSKKAPSRGWSYSIIDSSGESIRLDSRPQFSKEEVRRKTKALLDQLYKKAKFWEQGGGSVAAVFQDMPDGIVGEAALSIGWKDVQGFRINEKVALDQWQLRRSSTEDNKHD